MRTALLAVLVCGACQMATSADPPAPPPPSEERIKELVKKLETPTRHYNDTRPEPPMAGDTPTFDFRLHAPVLRELRTAGKAAHPALFDLIRNPKKPGHARAHAAYLLILALNGEGAKGVVDRELLAAVINAIRDKDLSLKWATLNYLAQYGKADVLRGFARTRPDQVEKPFDAYYFSDTVMDNLLPELLSHLKHDEPMVVMAAARAIAYFGRPNHGIPELVATLDHPEYLARAYAVLALGRAGEGKDPVVLRALLTQLKPARYPDGTYATVLEALATFGPKAKPALAAAIAVLEDDTAKQTERSRMDPSNQTASVYRAAMRVLAAIGPDAKEAAPAVLARMKDRVVQQQAFSDVIGTLDIIDPEAAKVARAYYQQLRDALNPPPTQTKPE